jgi:hypothetical protein
MLRRRGLQEHSVESIRRELVELDLQDRVERDAEASAFRLASRSTVSEDVYQQEVGLIRTRRRWIKEQRERLEAQLADLERFTLSPESLTTLRQRLDARLDGSTPEDQRFILDALGARVVAQVDGTWELQLEVPTGVVSPVQTASDIPRLGWG